MLKSSLIYFHCRFPYYYYSKTVECFLKFIGTVPMMINNRIGFIYILVLLIFGYRFGFYFNLKKGNIKR